MLTLRFMLEDEDETEVGYTSCPVVPRIGELVWLQRTSEFVRSHSVKQMESFKVVSVAYWMNDHDGGFRGMDSGSVAVYVKPVE